VFVLATTDPQKMSDTIRSRTQHLQFHLLPADTLAEHVRWVAADAGLEVSEAALEQALSRGGGSARDTLSALELVANTGDEGIDIVPLGEFVDAMIERDSGRGLTVIAHAISKGMDSRTLTEELIAFLRNGFLALMAPELVQVPSNRLDALAAQAQQLGAAGLVRGIELLGAALSEMRHAPDPRVLLDVAAVQLTADNVGSDVGALAQRLDRLERQVAEGVPAASEAAAPAAPVDPSTGRAALGGRARAAAVEPAPTAPRPAAESSTAASSTAEVSASRADAAAVADDPAVATPMASSTTPITADAWENTVRPALRGMARAVYAPASFIRSTESVLTLSVPNAVHRAKCEEQRSVVEAAVGNYVGAPVSVELLDGGGGGDDGGGGSRSGTPEPAAEPAPRPSLGETPPADITASSPRARGLAAAAAGASAPADDESFVVRADLPDDDDVDLEDLVDAPPESVKSPIDRLAEAFPGSELIEEAG
jgi:DNA polymerase-3 subunit gamma/tau